MYSITTRDGIVLQNIPDDIDPNSDQVRARVAAIRAQMRAGQTPPEVKPPEVTLADRARNLVTGADRQTRATAELPEIQSSGVLSGLGIGAGEAAKFASLLAVTPNPEEVAKLAQTLSPDLAVTQDEAGNLILANNRTGAQGVINKPGLTQLDLLQALGLGAAYSPAGGAASLGGLALRAGATQAAIEGAQAASGGEFNPTDVALSAVLAPAAPLAVAGVQAGAQQLRQRALPAITQAVQQGAQRATQAVRGLAGVADDAARPAAGTMGSAGAAGADMSAQRIATAEGLPVPINLTKGQASRDAAQLRFEVETAKNPTAGVRLRERADEQNLGLLRNFEALIESTGAEAPNIAQTGQPVVNALMKAAAADKARVRTAYKAAEKAGELEAPVSPASLVEYLNANAPEADLAPALSAVRRKLIAVGGAVEDDAGNLIPRDLTVNQLEQVRKTAVRAAAADMQNANNQRVAGQLRETIDAATEGAGGEAYKAARAMRREFAEKYENRAIVADLLTNRRGMADPRVAVENVFRRTVLNGSADDLDFLRKTLLGAGTGVDDAAAAAELRANGQQAWKELQGATLQHIRDAATRGVSTNQRGDPVISPAGLNQVVRELDKNGRLDLILGKKQAAYVRDLNEIAKVTTTTPPGVNNTSNTASVLVGALTESGITMGFTGLPVPVLSVLRVAANKVKDRRIQQRVNEALRIAKTKERSAVRAPASAAVAAPATPGVPRTASGEPIQ